MHDIEIRRGIISDFDRFYDYFIQSLKEQFPFYSSNSISYLVEVDYPKDWLRRQFEEEKKFCFLAFQEEEIVGYLMVSRPYGGVSMGNWIAVRPDYQKRGIAGSLLKLWEDLSLGNGAHALWLWTTENNLKFYKDQGFEMAGTFPKAWYGFDHYLFYKVLAEPFEENYLRDYLASKKLQND